MPKSASILSYIAGDERLLAAHMLSVRETMAWVEKHFAEGRTYADNPKGDPVRTGNLAYAIFQHDTSRKLDPQAHLHVVLANLTKVGERWQAVHNDQLWKNNSIIGSVYHAALRTRIEALGYRTELSGKHGQFEIEGVGNSVIREFSQRREDILAKAADLGRGADRPALLREITKRTRDDKINLEDREALRTEWRERAAGLGFDGKAVVAALSRVGQFSGAFRVLGERVVSAGLDYREAAARKWLELSAEDRGRTALYASGRETRAVLNEMVQDGLKSEGVLRGEGQALSRIETVHVTREELRYARTYRSGQLVDVIGGSRPAGLEHGQYRVVDVTPTGRVVLRDNDGRKHSFRPDRLDPNDRREALTLSERETIRIHEGERIRWTANDKARGLYNSAEAQILAITREGVEVRTSEGVNMLLGHGDRMLSRMGLAYAINMHQAQGMTSDHGIGVMHSSERQLSNQRLTHVMATRVRDDITIFTNDRDQLLRAIEANPGDKTSALEQIGEKAVERSANAAAQAGGSTKSSASADPFAIDPASLRVDPQLHGQAPKPQLTHVPEKTIELGL